MLSFDVRKRGADNKRKRKHDVFISHSSRNNADDHEFVDALADALRRRGFKVFLDRTHLRRQRLFEELYEAMNESYVGLVVLTQRASQSSWVESERREMRLRQQSGGMYVLVLRLYPYCPISNSLLPDKVIDVPDHFNLIDIAEQVGQIIRVFAQEG